MAIEIVDFPMKNGGSFHCYVSSPEGTQVHQNRCGDGGGGDAVLVQLGRIAGVPVQTSEITTIYVH